MNETETGYVVEYVNKAYQLKDKYSEYANNYISIDDSNN